MKRQIFKGTLKELKDIAKEHGMIEVEEYNEKILKVIKGNEYLETDERHTQGFQSGVKLAFKLIKDALQEREE